jgi:hypothetical protein
MQLRPTISSSKSSLRSSTKSPSPSLLNPSRKIGNLLTTVSVPVSVRTGHLSGPCRVFECTNLCVKHRRLHGLNSLPHRLLKSPPGGTQRSKEGDVDVFVGKGIVRVIVEILKGGGKSGNMRPDGGRWLFEELVEIAVGCRSSGGRNSAMFLLEAGPNLACQLHLIYIR